MCPVRHLVPLAAEAVGAQGDGARPEPDIDGVLEGEEPEQEQVRGRPASITLYRGFAKIEHKKYYGPDTIEKGKKIVDHVANVREIKEWNKITKEYETVITATCIREMNITNHPYQVRLVLDRERKVSDAYCGAKAQPPPVPAPLPLTNR